MVWKLDCYCQILLNNVVVNTQTFQTFSLLYLTLLINLQLWFWIKTLKPKGKEAGSLSKTERQKLHNLYTQGGAACGSLHNLVKTSNLPLSKVRQFLHSKPSYTKFALATRKFKRLGSVGGFKIENWCMDLAYVDKLANDKKGAEYLLVRQDLFHRTVDTKAMKTKDSKETVRSFLTMNTKKIRPTEFWVSKGWEFAGGFKNFANLNE